MKAQNNLIFSSAKLRKRAEELLMKKPSKSVSHFSNIETVSLLHELEVYQVELELQNEELLLAICEARDAIQLYDFAPSGFFTLSKEGEIVNLNLRGAQMLGEERKDLKNCLLGIFVSDGTKSIFNLFLDKIFNNLTKESCEVTLYTNGCLATHVHLTGIVSDDCEQCLVTAMDLIELKHAEQALNESEIKYRELVENSPDAIAIYSEGVIALVNKECLHLLAATNADELIGKSVIEFVHADYRAFVIERMKEVAIEGTVLPLVEEKFIRLDGSEVDVEVKSMSIRLDNKPAVQLIVRDITECKQVDAEIKLKNEALSKLVAEKDKLFSIIAHDLRSPFNALLGFTQMLDEDLPKMNMEEIQQIASVLKKSATNVYNLLENLLEWSSIRRGITGFDPTSLLLMSKIKESMQSILESAIRKEIEISFDIPNNMVVFADTNMFESIIRNLFSNAVKFTAKGGKITFMAKSSDRKFVEISIHDTGLGMNNEILDKLFSIDEQVSRKGTDNEPSTGLGLAICKDLIEKHGGRIWAESEEGKGSTFFFTLPGKNLNGKAH